MQTKLTIEISQDEASFIEEYAQKYQVTISELFDKYIKQLEKIDDRLRLEIGDYYIDLPDKGSNDKMMAIIAPVLRSKKRDKHAQIIKNIFW